MSLSNFQEVKHKFYYSYETALDFVVQYYDLSVTPINSDCQPKH